MTTPSVTGINVNFPETLFRNGIRFAMQMGAPTDDSLKATFLWTTRYEHAATDESNNPYDWAATPIATYEHDPVIVDVGVEFGDDDIDGRPMGHFDTVDAVVTVFDVDYENIQTADRVRLGGNEYIINYRIPEALFEVTTWKLYCVSVDES